MHGYILVVDDDPDSCDLLDTLLCHAGLTVKTAADGAAAMELVHQQAPALVLLDLMMPRKSGFHVLNELCGSPATRDIPVVVVSSLGDRRKAIKSLPGVAGVLEKGSFTLRDLKATVAAYITLPERPAPHDGPVG